MSSKDIESLLRERLSAESSRPLPSPGFEERVRRSLTARVPSRRRAHAVEALVGLAAVLALAAVALPWLIGPRSGVAGPGESASLSAAPTAEPTATPTATPAEAPLAHAQKWYLSFDYPADWTLTDRSVAAATDDQLSAMRDTDGDPAVFGFVGNAPASEDCVFNPPAIGNDYSCTTKWSLGDGTIALRFQLSEAVPTDATSYAWTAFAAVQGPEIRGATALTIDGLPARFAKSASDAIPYSTETVPGATEVLWWGLTTQRAYTRGYSVVAAIRGPNVSELEAQAEALVAGIHYVPETTILPTDPSAMNQARQAALEAALAYQKTHAGNGKEQAWDCFPTVVGASRDANITQTPTTDPLTQPLPVTCTVESMVPNVMQGWTLTLSQSWQAGSDYPAGKTIIVLQLGGDGQFWGGMFNPHNTRPSMYPHVGVSTSPG